MDSNNTAYAQMRGCTKDLSHIGRGCWAGANESEKSKQIEGPIKILKSNGFVHEVMFKGRVSAEKQDPLPSTFVPCFLESEEFLSQIGELPENYHPDYFGAM